jgi:hypothetical protein
MQHLLKVLHARVSVFVLIYRSWEMPHTSTMDYNIYDDCHIYGCFVKTEAGKKPLTKLWFCFSQA